MPTNSRAAAGLRLAFVVVVLAGFLGVFVLGGDTASWIDAIAAHREQLLAYTRAHFWLMYAAAGVLYCLATALIPGSAVLSLAIGMLFGRWLGTVLIVAAITLSAVCLFLATRHLFGEGVRRYANNNPLAKRVLAGFHDDGFHYLLFLRIAPLFPVWVVNVVPALTPIKTRTYLLATAIGMIPGSFVFANLGHSLRRVDHIEHLFSGELLIGLSLLGMLALIPVALKRSKAPRVRPEA